MLLHYYSIARDVGNYIVLTFTFFFFLNIFHFCYALVILSVCAWYTMQADYWSLTSIKMYFIFHRYLCKSPRVRYYTCIGTHIYYSIARFNILCIMCEFFLKMFTLLQFHYSVQTATHYGYLRILSYFMGMFVLKK